MVSFIPSQYTETWSVNNFCDNKMPFQLKICRWWHILWGGGEKTILKKSGKLKPKINLLELYLQKICFCSNAFVQPVTKYIVNISEGHWRLWKTSIRFCTISKDKKDVYSKLLLKFCSELVNEEFFCYLSRHFQVNT